MKREERYEDIYNAVQAALFGLQARMWTALPGVVESYDAAAMTMVVQPTIQGVLTDKDGVRSPVTIPLLLDVPVVFPHGGGFSMTFPIAAGDEVLVVFASRAIDNWWALGDVQPPAEFRMHSLSDGFAIPGPWSQPEKLADVSTDTVQLRSDEGDVYVELAAGAVVNVVAPGGINLTGPLNVTGNTTFTGQVAANGKRIDETHHHSGVTVGGGNTGPVT